MPIMPPYRASDRRAGGAVEEEVDDVTVQSVGVSWVR